MDEIENIFFQRHILFLFENGKWWLLLGLSRGDSLERFHNNEISTKPKTLIQWVYESYYLYGTQLSHFYSSFLFMLTLGFLTISPSSKSLIYIDTFPSRGIISNHEYLASDSVPSLALIGHAYLNLPSGRLSI